MPPSDRRLAFLGFGQIASALLDGLVAGGYPPQCLVVSGRDRKALAEKARTRGLTAAANNRAAVQGAEVIILAVKPNQARPVLTEIAPQLKSGHHLLLSLVAGLRLDTLRRLQPCQTIRVMPNLASRVRRGFTTLLAAPNVTAEQLRWTQDLFTLVGYLVPAADDHQMDVYTALCGSGPAYFYYFLEALVTSGLALGLAPEDARAAAVQTGLGALHMVAADRRPLAAHIDDIAVAKGTTRAALTILQSSNLEAKLQAACEAATRRADAIGQELDRL